MACSLDYENLSYMDLVPAAEDGDLDKVEEILKLYPLKVDMMSGGKTAMHVAARNGDIKMMMFLVGNEADYNIQDFEDNTPLHYAVMGDRPNAVKHLLNLGANENEENSKGKTAAQIAFDNNYTECQRYFFKRNPEIPLKTKAVISTLADRSGKKMDLMDTDKPVTADPSIGKCHYCKEEIATVTFEPCDHTASCFGCSLNNMACPCGKAYTKISYRRTKSMENYIEKLKATKKELMQSRQSSISCTICTDRNIDCILECGHLFCHQCVRNWKGSRNQYGQQCWKCFKCKIDSRYTKIYL